MNELSGDYLSENSFIYSEASGNSQPKRQTSLAYSYLVSNSVRESHPSAAAAHVAAWLLVGRLLDHLGPRRPPFPIVAIEDAEAHLHPVLPVHVHVRRQIEFVEQLHAYGEFQEFRID